MTISFSVVVPVHNAGQYLQTTLDALATQTRPPDEIIVVDDGSSDGGAAVVESIVVPTETTLRLVTHDSALGEAAARNHGASLAQGDWIGFCDNDDVWHPSRIARIEEAIGRHNVGAVGTGAMGFALQKDKSHLMNQSRAAMVDAWVAQDDPQSLAQLVEVGSGRERVLGWEDFRTDGCVVTTTLFVKRDLHFLAGGFTPVLRTANDWAFHAAIATLAPVLLLDEPLVFYRIRAGSTSSESGHPMSMLAGALALRFGVEDPKTSHAGALYEHFTLEEARQGGSTTRSIGLALLGNLGSRFLLTLIHARLSARVRELPQKPLLRFGGVRGAREYLKRKVELDM